MYVKKIGQACGNSVRQASKALAEDVAREAKRMDQFEKYLVRGLEETEEMRKTVALEVQACETLGDLMERQRQQVALDTEIATILDILIEYRKMKGKSLVEDDLTGLAKREADYDE